MILTPRDWQAKIPSSAPIAASITTSPAARVQAARFVLEAAGHGIENRRLLARSGDDDEKPLHQLSLQALGTLHGTEAQVREARAAIIEVEGAHTPPPLAYRRLHSPSTLTKSRYFQYPSLHLLGLFETVRFAAQEFRRDCLLY